MQYVNGETLIEAGYFRLKFTDLPPSAGVLFVSVRPRPTETGRSREFDIVLGIRLDLTEGAGSALVDYVLKEEIELGYKFYVGIHRGVSGAGRDYDSPTASSAEA